MTMLLTLPGRLRLHEAWRPRSIAALLAFVVGLIPAPGITQTSDSSVPPENPENAQESTAAPEVQPIPVAEQEPEPVPEGATQLDTIEVTASKRVKSQRDLPGSVGAIRGADLEKINAQGMEDYMKLIPGVSLTDYGTGRQIPVIRGIASSTGAPGSQFTGLTTGIFLDDIPFNDLFAPLSIPDLNPFDLERVEVLKGPQGTLFGSSALAGAIRYVVQKPVIGVWQTKVSTTATQTKFAEDLSKVGAGALNIPVGDTAAVRLVGVYRDESGYYDSRANGGNTRDEADINRLKQFTGRVLGRWDVSDELNISALYFTQDTEQHDQGSANQPDRPERNDVPFPSPFESGFGGANLGATYDFDWARLLYSGNLLDKSSYSKGHLEPSLPNQLGNQQDQSWYSVIIGDVKGYTHELRLSSPEGGDSDWEWLGGVAFLNYQQDFFQFTPNPGPADSGYYANPPENPEDVAEEDQQTSFLWATIDGNGTEKSVFGEVTRRLGDHWEATGGLRAFETELIADSVITGAQIVALSTPGQPYNRTHSVATGEGVNPKLSLRYLHDRNIQAFLLAAKGYQFGGFQINPPIANTRQATEAKGFTFGPYKSSELWNYELGLRTEWLDRRLRFDLTAFYLDWTNLQLTIRVPINPTPIPQPPGGGTPENVDIGVIVNVGAAHSEGLEASLEVAPFAGATFTSAAAWISARTDVPFDEDHPAGPVPAGARLPGSPRFQWANVFAYEHSLPYFTSWNAGLALTHVHIGTSPDDLRPEVNIGGYDTLDARVNLVKLGTVWIPEISLGVNNLTDVRGVAAYGGDGGAVNAYSFVRPRTTLMTLSWRY